MQSVPLEEERRGPHRGEGHTQQEVHIEGESLAVLRVEFWRRKKRTLEKEGRGEERGKADEGERDSTLY